MKTITYSTFFLFILNVGVFVSSMSQDMEAIEKKYREFDFWIGEWDVYKYGTDTLVGASNIASIVDGKAIRETYQATGSAYQGTSLNKYNPQINQWEQFWVDNGGLTLHIKGGIEAGKMVLQNEMDTSTGTLRNKITWEAESENSVRQTWEQSTDGGNTWQIVFDGQYKPKK